jgi:hypothetical protein
MGKKSTSNTGSTKKVKLGEQIRNIADRLKQETEVQIKATSRILGAAAQISENHEKLINEVVDMVEEDLDRQAQTYQPDIYTVEIIKRQFKTLREAREHFQIKASSWGSLVDKLNRSSKHESRHAQLPTISLCEACTTKVVRISEPEVHPISAQTTKQHPQKLMVYLEQDVVEFFPNSEAVNEALRFLIRVTKPRLP